MGLRFADPSFFADLKLLQVRKNLLFSLTNLALNARMLCKEQKSFIKMSFRTVLGHNCAIFNRNFRICNLRINPENLLICDLRSDTHTKEIYRLARGEWAQEFADLRCIRTSQKKLACPLLLAQCVYQLRVVVRNITVTHITHKKSLSMTTFTVSLSNFFGLDILYMYIESMNVRIYQPACLYICWAEVVCCCTATMINSIVSWDFIVFDF